MNITRTIQQSEDPAFVASFFDGTVTMDEEWPFAQRIRNVEKGDFLFVIYRGEIVGRLAIVDVVRLDRTRAVLVGSNREPVEGKTIVTTRCPGEKPKKPIKRRPHRGHKYDPVSEW
jgi:hypothetical protein